MAKAWGWSEKQVRTFLMRLERDRQIARQTGQLQTVITICNYELYQSPLSERGQQTGQQSDRQRAGKGPEEEQGNKVTIDDDEDSTARIAEWQSSDAYKLAKQIAKIAGQTEEFEFSGWGGAAYRVQQWLNTGWPAELILASVREQAAKKQRGPARLIQYFEPGIADAIARQRSPLPTAQITEIQGRRHANDTKSGLAAIDRIFGQIDPTNRPEAVADANENVVLSLPSRSIP
jgi:hypothetical protein